MTKPKTLDIEEKIYRALAQTTCGVKECRTCAKNLAELVREFYRERLEALKDDSVKGGDQYWMWNSLHNVYEYGKKVARNNIIEDAKKIL